jgi:hypothetical protein
MLFGGIPFQYRVFVVVELLDCVLELELDWELDLVLALGKVEQLNK